MKERLLWMCAIAFCLGVIAWLWMNPVDVQEAIESTNKTITDGRQELQAAYERAEQMTQTTVTRIETRKQEVKTNVEAMEPDAVADTINFELALWRSGDGTEGIYDGLSGVSPDFGRRARSSDSLTATPVRAQ